MNEDNKATPLPDMRVALLNIEMLNRRIDLMDSLIISLAACAPHETRELMARAILEAAEKGATTSLFGDEFSKSSDLESRRAIAESWAKGLREED